MGIVAESVRLLLRNRSYLYWFLVCTVYWFSHRPIGSFLSLLVRERGGDAGTYGNVCGAGAVFEFLCLLLMSRGGILKKPGMLMPAALLTDLLRPLCFLAFPGLMPVYAGQVLQSLSFALYYTASVDRRKTLRSVRTGDPPGDLFRGSGSEPSPVPHDKKK